MIKVKITQKAYLKLKYYIKDCDSEISGLGKVREVKNNGKPFLEIYNLEILPQEVSGVHSDLDEDAKAKFLFKKLSKGHNTEDYKVWWHSHPDFAAIFSPDDINTINDSTEFPYLISIVANKRGEMEVRLDIFKPLRFTAKKIKLQIPIEIIEDNKLRELCQKQIKQKVRAVLPERINDLEEEVIELDGYGQRKHRWWGWNGIRGRH